MLDTEETAPQQANTLGREIGAPTASVRERNKRLRGWAAGLGLIGTLLALAVPFLPVTYDQVDLRWPTVQGTRAVSAPPIDSAMIRPKPRRYLKRARSHVRCHRERGANLRLMNITSP